MAYKVIILYRLYMPSYFLGTFTEYPSLNIGNAIFSPIRTSSRKGNLQKYDGIPSLSVKSRILISLHLLIAS